MIVFPTIGLFAWLLFVASAGVESEPRGIGVYELFIFGAAFILGISLRANHFLAGSLLLAPALLLAGWTAPRGDEDGMWVLIFPILLFYIAVAAEIHYLGSKFRRTLK